MSEFINKISQAIISERELRALFKNQALPAVLSNDFLNRIGYAPVLPAPKPIYNPITQVVARQGAVQNTIGSYVQRWVVLDLTPDVIESRMRDKIALIRQEIVNEAQRRLDQFAHSRGYGNQNGDGAIISAVSYLTSRNAVRKAEAELCVQLRDDMWDVIFQVEAEVLAGQRQLPESFADIESITPVLSWGNIPALGG